MNTLQRVYSSLHPLIMNPIDKVELLGERSYSRPPACFPINSSLPVHSVKILPACQSSINLHVDRRILDVHHSPRHTGGGRHQVRLRYTGEN